MAPSPTAGTDRFVIISGCSGGGKSSLLRVLRLRGYAVVEEPGRRIVASELESGGLALPWVDGVAFARRALELSLADRASAERLPGLVFFDRSLIDAAAALRHFTAKPAIDGRCRTVLYNRQVFVTPPWPEIYVMDQERRHEITEAMAEYDRLIEVYPSLGYEICVLPKIDVGARADFILTALHANPESEA